jgi:hypothetical protein
MTIHQRGLTSRACAQARRITERYLRLTEKLLHEQRRNLMKLPMDRRRGRQCLIRGSRPVVLDGVTPVQGGRESLPQGEGVERFRASEIQRDSNRLSEPTESVWCENGGIQPELERRMR